MLAFTLELVTARKLESTTTYATVPRQGLEKAIRYIFRAHVSVKSHRPLREEGPIRRPATYPRQTAFELAILETDESKMHGRLYDAIAAVEQRRLIPVNSDEEIALADAEAGLQVLILESIAKFV